MLYQQTVDKEARKAELIDTPIPLHNNVHFAHNQKLCKKVSWSVYTSKDDLVPEFHFADFWSLQFCKNIMKSNPIFQILATEAGVVS